MTTEEKKTTARKTTGVQKLNLSIRKLERCLNRVRKARRWMMTTNIKNMYLNISSECLALAELNIEWCLDYLTLDKCNKTKCFNSESDEAESRILNAWISKMLVPRKTVNHSISSYGLKHVAEKEIGFYVSEDDFKKAMTTCGFKSLKPTQETPWYFFVSNKTKDGRDIRRMPM